MSQPATESVTGSPHQPDSPQSAAPAAASPTHKPVISFDPSLPIAAHADEIRELLAHHQVVVVAGETGSGKTTQLPKICLQLGRHRIAHTQPRRIAARSVAERLASELQVPLGDVVGYQVRFTRQASADTQITVMTDGILLAQINHDRDLRRYDTIIIDEAHERSLNIDFLLGYLRQLIDRRPDLLVVITSATIDTARFSHHFDDAPVIEVSGRTYPVEIRYRPLDEADGEPLDQAGGICQAVRELIAEGPGDILVFLSGEREIRDAADALAGEKLPNTEILPLYAKLSAAEQHRVFQSHGGRRIVLATNVAETSLTVPGIRYVIDPGTARISRYSTRTKVQRLPIEPVSQASANQRAGRCGRLGPGICIRLYSEQDYLARPEFTEPEILRTNLASVILQMAEAKLGDIADFPFVEAPDRTQIGDGLRLLDELGALKPGNRGRPRLTRTGHQLATIPLDPRMGRMVVEAARLGCLREVLIIVSALAIPDVREYPQEQRARAEALHRRFWTDAGTEQPDPAQSGKGPKRYTVHTGRREMFKPEADSGGDIIAILRLWEYLSAQRHARSGNGFRRMCREEFLHFLRIREWQDLHTQLKQITKDLHLERNHAAAPRDEVLTAVLSGLLGQVGLLEEREPASSRGRRRGPREYLGARGTHFAIGSGSALSGHPPELVMAVELVDTGRLWAHTVAEVTVEQIEKVGAHALKHTISEPHWSAASGSVVAFERVTLYGVPIVAERPVNYARLHPEDARAIFIRSALVEGDWRTRHPFFRHNQEVREQAEELEERRRRRDLLVDDQVIFAFYDRRIPPEVVSGSHFDAWWRRQPDKTILDLGLDDLLVPDAEIDADAFPDHWTVEGTRLPVQYVFEPGAGRDGVTVTVPLAALNSTPVAPFTWQVPGLRDDLATELIRSLPKQYRVQFVPAPDHARKAVRWLATHDADRSRPLWLELGRALHQLTGEQVPADAWRPHDVPGHLRPTFDIVDAGKVVASGKDLGALQEKLRAKVTATLTRRMGAREGTRRGTDWVFGTIPTSVTSRARGVEAVGYPALVDEGSAVAQAVLDSPERQAMSHAAGLRRLLTLVNPDPAKWVVSHLTNADKLALGNSPYPDVPALLADARLKTADRLMRRHTDPASVRDEAAFRRLAVEVRQDQAGEQASVVHTIAEVLRNRSEVLRLAAHSPLPDMAADVTDQMNDLVFVNFASATADPWFDRLPVYVAGMALRLRTAPADPTRDAQRTAVLDELEAGWAEICDRQPPGRLPSTVEEVGFWIEELRIQLFAQQLHTAISVSPKRIRQALAALA